MKHAERALLIWKRKGGVPLCLDRDGRNKTKTATGKNSSSSRGKWTNEKLPQETLIYFAQIVNQNLAELLMEESGWETL